MKNKRLIILLSIFAFLTIVVILCSTIFTLRSVTFSWKCTKVHLSEYTDEQIAKSVDLGDSIFLLNKNKMAEKLEITYPYIKVIKIETKFPNKVVVHATERDSVYAVTLGDGRYAVIDDENKVLEHCTQDELDNWDENISVKPIVANVNVNGDLFNLSEKDFPLGYVADVRRVTTLLRDIAYTLKTYGYPQNYLLKGFASKLDVNIAYQSNVLISTYFGLKIEIKDCYQSLSAKVQLGFSVYEAQRDANVTTGIIVVEGKQAYIE